MNLDEAIKHCYEKAAELKAKADQNKLDVVEAADCLECAEEHRQLAAWLEDYKRLLLEPIKISPKTCKAHLSNFIVYNYDWLMKTENFGREIRILRNLKRFEDKKKKGGAEE